jgi:hypothetical protein
MTVQLGYCTNVHAGANLEQTRANLERHALGVKKRFSPDAPMGIGLWLSASSARALLAGDRLADWQGWLAEAGLVPFTLNGFPFGDFHQAVVKHEVYRPTWFEPARLGYTRNLVTILDRLLPAGLEGSISTLPLAWGKPAPGPAQLQRAADALRTLARELARLEQERGRLISLCIEPEPGCILQRSTDVVRFFEDHLLTGPDEPAVRRHLCVCHDVCHAAVMFEEQADVLNRYRAAGLAVGKIQVSSAVAMPLAETPPGERPEALRQLAGFNENRYLHQTLVLVRPGPDAEPVFYEDLPQALAANPDARDGEWRVHFHVPIYLERFGRLRALQQPLLECLRLNAAQDLCRHLEVETYAWGVLPPELQQPELAAGIAEEMRWCQSAWHQLQRNGSRG